MEIATRFYVPCTGPFSVKKKFLDWSLAKIGLIEPFWEAVSFLTRGQKMLGDHREEVNLPELEKKVLHVNQKRKNTLLSQLNP